MTSSEEFEPLEIRTVRCNLEGEKADEKELMKELLENFSRYMNLQAGASGFSFHGKLEARLGAQGEHLVQFNIVMRRRSVQ